MTQAGLEGQLVDRKGIVTVCMGMISFVTMFVIECMILRMPVYMLMTGKIHKQILPFRKIWAMRKTGISG